jgi:acyl dehydratase
MIEPEDHQTPSVGDVRTRTIGPVGVRDFVRYAGASGDFNPLHYDPEFAQSAGFPSVFAQGMFHGGVLASFAAAWLGPDNVRRVQVRFVAQVWPGDTLIFRATITAKPEHKREVEVALICERQTGQVAARGTAVFALAEGVA